jgi:hypothetical protein
VRERLRLSPAAITEAAPILNGFFDGQRPSALSASLTHHIFSFPNSVAAGERPNQSGLIYSADYLVAIHADDWGKSHHKGKIYGAYRKEVLIE